VGSDRSFAKSLGGFLTALEYALESEDLARAPGLLQRLDPRVKVAGILTLVLAAAAARRLDVIAALFAVALALALASRIPVRTLAARVWAGALFFSGLVALPAPFITPGRIVAHVPWLGWPVSAQGMQGAAYLISRVETTATLALLLVLSTPWTSLLKALRIFRTPVLAIVILGMTYRYLLLLLASAREMMESRRSRLVGALPAGERRRLLIGAAGVLLTRSLDLSGEVYLAMQSRGFRGEVYVLHDFRMLACDWLALAAFIAAGGTALWIGR